MTKYRNNDPRQIGAKYKCKCAETGQIINKGESCIYYPLNKQVFALNSKQAQEFREMMQDDIL